MRNSFKKLLSIMLVIGIMAGSFVFAMPALADSGVVLHTNGGTLASSDPIEAGDLLPTYEGITREGCTFGGWFTNSDFTGAQSFVAVANTPYYARWVAPTVVQNFDGWNDSDYSANIAFHKYVGTEAVSTLNKDSAYAFSGNNSAYVGPIQNNADYGQECHLDDRMGTYRFFGSQYEHVQEGYYFWIYNSGPYDVTIKIYLPWYNRYSLTIPAGTKQLITADAVSAGDDYSFRIVFHGVGKTNWNRTCKLYVDDIGTFTDVPYVSGTPVTLNTNGGTLVDADAEYYAENALPTANDITKEGCHFLGWYDNAEFTGTPVTVAKSDGVYYAKWVYFTSFDNVESQTSVGAPWVVYPNSGDAFVAPPSINTNAANAWDGTKSIKIDLKNQKTSGGGWSQWECLGLNAKLEGTRNTEGLYLYVKSNCGTGFRVVMNPDGGAQNGTLKKDVGLTAGDNHIFIPWSDFGEGVTENTATSFNFVFQARWTKDAANYDTGTIYIDCAGAYSSSEIAPAPSYGVATPAKGGMFAAGDAGANTAAGIDNIDGAIYEVDGVKYTAFRVFGTYIAPNDESAAAPKPIYDKIVVDANGTTETIESRHVMLGYGAEPDVNNHYAMSTVTEDFDKCWSAEQLDDGSWRVTYSLLLKGIPEAYAATSFYAGSAVVTANGTYAGNSINNVSAQVMYEAMGDSTITWFTNAQ